MDILRWRRWLHQCFTGHICLRCKTIMRSISASMQNQSKQPIHGFTAYTWEHQPARLRYDSPSHSATTNQQKSILPSMSDKNNFLPTVPPELPYTSYRIPHRTSGTTVSHAVPMELPYSVNRNPTTVPPKVTMGASRAKYMKQIVATHLKWKKQQ